MTAGRLMGVSPVVLALVIGGATGCDPMPMIRLKNETMLGATVRFQKADGGYLEHAYKVPARGVARFPAGFTLNQHVVLASGGCDITFPLIPEGVVNGAMGALTPLKLDRDGRLYVDRSKDQPQPTGWPLAPISRTCR